MFQFCRKVVAGPKKKLEWNGKELDLTYVTDRIIAMAFPASGIEKAYRNSIKDVSQYLQQKHGDNYLIVNVSSRKYDYKFFNNQVIDFEWADHLSPTLTTLFEICLKMYEFLSKSKSGVVAVHCNHGKGRTGTTIISFIMFTGFFSKFEEALAFYNKRRFVSLTYGVSQPCQKRYLKYFESLQSEPKIDRRLIAYKIKNIKQHGLEQNKYYVEVTGLRKNEPKYRKVGFNEGKTKFYPSVPLMGDIFIQIFQNKWNGDEEVAVINSNLYFLNEGIELKQFVLHDQEDKVKSSTCNEMTRKRFDGESIKVNGKHTTKFSIEVDFEQFCDCHIPKHSNPDCLCQEDRVDEEKCWSDAIKSVEVSKFISKDQSVRLLFYHHNLGEKEQDDRAVTEKIGQSLCPSNKIIEEKKQIVEMVEKEEKSKSEEFDYELIVLNRNSV